MEKVNLELYVLYQVARFGALTVPQIMHLCEGKYRRAMVYYAIDRLMKRGAISKMVHAITRTRGYRATDLGRAEVLEPAALMTPNMTPMNLDHTAMAAETLINLSLFENVTGIAGRHEISPEAWTQFSHDHIPAGLFQVTEGGKSREIGLDIWWRPISMKWIEDVLQNYIKAFKLGLQCQGALIIVAEPSTAASYTAALKKHPQDFHDRVRIVVGAAPGAPPRDGYGALRIDDGKIWDLIRTPSPDGISFSLKNSRYLAKKPETQHPGYVPTRTEISSTDLSIDV